MLAGCLLHGPRPLHERPGPHRALARAPARRAGGAHRRPAPPRTSSRARAARSAAGAARCCARATRGSTCARRRGARACAAPPAASRRAAACWRSASSARGSLMAARAPSSRAAATPSTSSPAPPGRARQVREPQRAAGRASAGGFDWLLVIDDDVALPRGFLDALPVRGRGTGLQLAQPAHRLHSHAAWPVTRRHPGRLARDDLRGDRPGDGLPRDTFAALLPFPASLPMGWGLDVHWAAVARRARLADRHRRRDADRPHAARRRARLRPRRGRAQARAFLAGRPYIRRDEVRTLAVHR